MTDIFISYARNDRTQAEKLARALESEGWSVWWDVAIPAGKTFDVVIEQALNTAKCVIVLWSKESIKSRWVRTEAEEAAASNKLVPVLIEKVDVPLAFRRIQAADFTTWRGDRAKACFTSLKNDLISVLGSPARVGDARPQRLETAGGRDSDTKRYRRAQADLETTENAAVQMTALASTPRSALVRRWFLVLLLAAAVTISIFAVVFQLREGTIETARLNEELATVKIKTEAIETKSKAEAGDPNAQVQFGEMFEYGTGVPQDKSEAMRWYRRAVEQTRHSLALLRLSGLARSEDPPDYVSALMWSYLNPDNTYEKAQAHADIQDLEQRMSPEQIASAKNRAKDWSVRYYRR